MSKPRPTNERCPSCGKATGVLSKQSPQRQEIKCRNCEHVWTFWRGKRLSKRHMIPEGFRKKMSTVIV